MENFRKTSLGIVILFSLFLHCETCDNRCAFETHTLGREVYMRNQVLLDAFDNYLVVVTNGTIRVARFSYQINITNGFYGIIRSYDYRDFNNVTIYEYNSGAWKSVFEKSYRDKITDVSITKDTVAILTNYSRIHFVDHKDRIWDESQVIDLNSRLTSYYKIKIFVDKLSVLCRQSFSLHTELIHFEKTGDLWAKQRESTVVKSCSSNSSPLFSMAVYKSFIVVGCSVRCNGLCLEQNSVVIFKNNTHHQTIYAYGLGLGVLLGGSFGNSIAMDEDRLIVSGNYLFIYEYENGLWVKKSKISKPNPAYEGPALPLLPQYGPALVGLPLPSYVEPPFTSVAIQGKYLIFSTKDYKSKSGHVFLYKNMNGKWKRKATLLASNEFSSRHFGSKVTISSNKMIVGGGGVTCYYCSEPPVYIYDNLMTSSNSHVPTHLNHTQVLKSVSANSKFKVFMGKKYMLVGTYEDSYKIFSHYGKWVFYGYTMYRQWSAQYNTKTYKELSIYRYVKNTWEPLSMPNWIAVNATVIDYDDNNIVTLNSNPMGKYAISRYRSKIFAGVETWRHIDYINLPNDTMYNHLFLRDDVIITLGRQQYSEEQGNVTMYVYKLNSKEQYNVSLDHSCMKEFVIERNNNTIIAGCPHFSSQSGIVFIFEFGEEELLLKHKLRPDVIKLDSYYGRSLAIHENQLVVGRPGFQSGMVHIYRFVNNHWIEKEILEPSTPFLYVYFGCDVSLNDRSLVIGSKGSDHINADNTGTVYLFLFVNDTWVEGEQLMNPNQRSDNFFGASVNINGNNLIVTTESKNDTGVNNVFIYNLSATNSSVTDGGQIEEKKTNVDLLECNKQDMTAYWSKTSFNYLHVDFKFRDESCNKFKVYSNDTMYWIEIDHFSCGIALKENTERISLTTALTASTDLYQHSSISRGVQLFHFYLECSYVKDVFVSMHDGYKAVNKVTKQSSNSSSKGVFEASIDFFESTLYTKRVEYPIEVTLNEQMYIHVSMEENPRVKMVVEKCYATDSPTLYGETYVFFINKCPFDNTFQILSTGENHFNFRINAFEFIQRRGAIYLHCAVRICSRSSTSHSCRQSCDYMRQRRALQDDTTYDKDLESDIKYLSSGEIVYTMRPTCADVGNLCPLNSKCIDINPTVCRCNEGYVFSNVDNKCHNKRTTHCKIFLNIVWDDEYANHNSPVFLKFAVSLERKLYRFFVGDLLIQILGVKVTGVERGVFIEVLVVFANDVLKGDIEKELMNKIQDYVTINETKVTVGRLSVIAVKTVDFVDQLPSNLSIVVGIAIPGFFLIFMISVVYFFKHNNKKNVSVKPDH